MTAFAPSDPIFNAYDDFFRIHVHELVEIGFDAIRSSVRLEMEEEDITTLLYDAIKKYLRNSSSRKYRNYDIHNESPFSNDKLLGKNRKFIDLMFVFVTKHGRPEYIIEAKSLNWKKNYQRTGNYTDSEAMMRFIAGEYAVYTARYPEVMMLGYVMDKSSVYWRDKLKEAISKKRATLSLRGEQEDTEIIDSLGWKSDHDRASSQNPIAIYHVLLDFCSLF